MIKNPKTKLVKQIFKWDINPYKLLLLLPSSQWFDIIIYQLTYLFVLFTVDFMSHLFILHVEPFSTLTLQKKISSCFHIWLKHDKFKLS